ncbi:Clathrin light chain B [Monocercomonoides exilis]|uniref:Clathrin light chain B n=1 Tax=Monocercomonoides exilis TaxID=2049356 RepID=UPI00355A286F|nr:Clathrin light chain B [Monocercomonoides exilis]|eukprot:MONOS_6145.1-p1 / transcript=MONOS_6145.1 / gene=MONOS_6145 / organism=Monocercomonoides_exilis_PA203 / gene_product=unspecified product / transcript_product=unspecified product / location=Mono_scaffold00189:86372-87044(-) / protein_length=174 / sequence_SO=supercontig / SO=protein_coding / is_pseudo=false
MSDTIIDAEENLIQIDHNAEQATEELAEGVDSTEFIEAEASPEAEGETETVSLPTDDTEGEQSSAEPELTPMQRYYAQHAIDLQKLKDTAAKMLEETLAQAEKEKDSFLTERAQAIEMQKKKNQEEEEVFLENRKTAAPWEAAANMCDFQISHEKDVDRMKQMMMRLKNQGKA